MALKITCPHCGEPKKLEEPFPQPGTELQCLNCGRALAISYPPGMVGRLRERGVRFSDDPPPPDPSRATDHRLQDRNPPLGGLPGGGLGRAAPPEPPPATRGRTLQPASPPPAAPPRAAPRAAPTPRAAAPRASAPRPAAAPSPAPSPARASSGGKPPPASRRRSGGGGPPEKPKRKKRSLLRRLLVAAVVLCVLGGAAGAGVLGGAFWYYGQNLPTVDFLQQYEPPTVTTVYDYKGRLMGEIYEQRRYVTPLDDIPKHVQDAFIAAEDANFWTHTGVDYEGIVRAILRNALQGRKAQGASTVTMQVARNFLLTKDKTYERKIKEIILSNRIEETFSKEHILFLYLNEIYLGSGAYGVEAASRTYFGKSVKDITVAEAAILAGLPQRPSDYSPHRNWDKARARQEYVLGQLEAKGYLTAAQKQEALAEKVNIYLQDNEFLTAAPYFTEHVRRYLVETYGHDKIYNDGLSVWTTADLDLQKTAQEALQKGVLWADEQTGWRGPIETVPASQIQARRDKVEAALLEELGKAHLTVADPSNGGGYKPAPAKSVLEEGRVYEAVVTDVAEKHAVVGIGAHRALIPLSWTTWGYEPNPERSFKYRKQSSMENVLNKGDVVQVRLEARDSQTVDNLKGYDGAGPGPFAAARLYQSPDLQGALFSYRQSDGAVLSMVGGIDFEDSEYNRVTQARRQVGSTFKPIVYSAAIGEREFTAGSIVQDAPTVFQTIGDKLWKPGNYGGEYLGDITLRRALQLSRNVCTVRVLDKVGLEPVFQQAGPKLRIGYNEPSCSRVHVPETSKEAKECKGEVTDSNVAGMVWCEYCDPTSCPLVMADKQSVRVDGEDRFVNDAKQCLDEPVSEGGNRWCHSCDVNLRVCDWLPIDQIPDTDPCVDARKDDKGRVMCRSCDLSMGLGSSSLTMVELARAYSAFATYGKLVEPHWINKVVDRDGTVIEEWQPPSQGWPQVLEPGVAAIAHWLLREVATGGTAARTNRLGIQVAGKTGTTNDFFDAWFVGYDPELITASWVGYDTPRSIGVSFTGGKTALPIWMDFMAVAAPKEEKRRFKALPGVEYVSIDETNGRAAVGGRSIPFLPNTAPTNIVGEVGQKSTEDLLISDF